MPRRSIESPLPCLALVLLAITLEFAPAALAVDPATGETPSCRRDEGNLTRYLLCLELQARRAPESHARYYAELAELESRAIADLPRGRAKRRGNVLTGLYHARHPAGAFAPRQTLVDALDGRRRDRLGRLAADCDVFSLINVGVAERYFGAEFPTHRVVIVRTRRDHVVSAFEREGRFVALLETEDGSIYHGRPTDRDGFGSFHLMNDREVTAMYLAHVGLALAREGRDGPALRHLDEALRLNPGEFVANAGRALTLLLAVAGAPDRASSEATPWCAGPADAPLLAEAARSAVAAMHIDPGSENPYSLLGKIRFHQCRSEEALSHLRHAVELSSDPLDLYYIGLILSERDRLDEAIRQVRRGRKLIRSRGDERYLPLRAEMEFLLARTHALRAEREASARDLRRAMRLLASVRQIFPGDETVTRLERAIEQLDYRIGPVRPNLGIPRTFGRSLYNASLDD